MNSFIKGMVVSLTHTKALKLQNMFDKMKMITNIFVRIKIQSLMRKDLM